MHFGVHFQDHSPAGDIQSKRLYLRSGDPARSTPWSPEIDQNRNACRADNLRTIVVAYFEGIG